MCVCDLSKYVNQTAGSKALLVVVTLSCVVNTIHSDLRHKTCSGEVIVYLEMQSPKSHRSCGVPSVTQSRVLRGLWNLK